MANYGYNKELITASRIADCRQLHRSQLRTCIIIWQVEESNVLMYSLGECLVSQARRNFVTAKVNAKNFDCIR